MKKIHLLISVVSSACLIAAMVVLIMSVDALRKAGRDFPQTLEETAAETSGSLLEEEPEDASPDTGEEVAVAEAEPVGISMVFAGDIYLSEYVLNNYHQSGIEGVLSPGYLQVMKDAQITMVNQEFPFSLGGTPADDKQYTFRIDPQYAGIFTQLGVDIVTLANNHTLDYGEDALLDTLETLNEAGIPYVGAGHNLSAAKAPVVLEAGGSKIGFLGASRVIPFTSWNATSTKPGLLTTYDTTLLIAEIQALKEVCDVVVVYVHWGNEREEYPKEYQRDFGRQYIDAGADIVIGSHPHVLQGIEFYQGRPIIYSLGNFIFGSSIPKTMLLKVDYEPDEGLRLYALPGTSAGGYTRDLEGGEGEEILKYLESISYGVSIGADGEIREE